MQEDLLEGALELCKARDKVQETSLIALRTGEREGDEDHQKAKIQALCILSRPQYKLH